MRGRVALLGAVVTALAVPAGASAEKMVSYGVTIEGEGVYDYDHQTSSSRHLRHAKWSWRTEIPIVVFQGDRVYTQSAENETGTITSALVEEASGQSWGAGDYGHCEPTKFDYIQSGRFVEDDVDLPTPDPQLTLRVLGGLTFDFDWCNDWAWAGFDLLGGVIDGVHTFDTVFSIPREAVGMGRIIQLVHEDVSGKRCPENFAGMATSCTLSFDATVTFDKIAETEDPSEGPPPADEPPVITEDDIPMPPPAGAGPGPQQPAPTVIAPDGVTVNADGTELPASVAKAALSVSCPAACQGEVAAVPLNARGGAGKGKALASKAFKMGAAGSQKVVVRFSKRAKRRIRDAGGVALKVRTVVAGKADERVVLLKVKGSGAPSKGGPRPLSSGGKGG